MLGVGTGNYFGDIGGSATANNWLGIKDIQILGTRPSFLAGARYKITQSVAVRLNLAMVVLGGRDKGSSNFQRGYSFNSIGLEHALLGEYYILSEDSRRTSFALFNRRGMLNNYSKKSVYIFGGVGGLFMKPILKKDSVYDKINDVINESSIYTLALPAGIGVKMIYNNRLAFSAEFGARYTLSDYLDGFTSKISNFNDVYYFMSFNIVYRIKTSRNGYPILFRSY